MSALLTRKRVFAAKIEAVAGTPETLAAGDGAENFFNPQFKADIPAFEREGQGSLSALPSVPGARSAQVSVQTHLYNSGTATEPFWATVLLLACGFQKTGGAYVPSTGAATTITGGHYVHGNLYEVAGAQGNVKIMGDKVGEPLKMDWDFTGLYVAPSATTILAPTYPTAKPPRFAGATLTLGSVTPFIVRKFEFDMGNKVVLRESAANVSGYIGSVITDRKVSIKLTVEVPPIGTYDYYNDLLTSVEAAFSCAVGSGTNGIVTIAAPKIQLRTAPQLSDADGIFTYELEYGCNRSASAGDDEITITCT